MRIASYPFNFKLQVIESWGSKQGPLNLQPAMTIRPLAMVTPSLGLGNPCFIYIYKNGCTDVWLSVGIWRAN